MELSKNRVMKPKMERVCNRQRKKGGPEELQARQWGEGTEACTQRMREPPTHCSPPTPPSTTPWEFLRSFSRWAPVYASLCRPQIWLSFQSMDLCIPSPPTCLPTVSLKFVVLLLLIMGGCHCDCILCIFLSLVPEVSFP